MLFSINIVAFATASTDDVVQFGDVLYVNDEIAVFYGNPNESAETIAKARNIELHATARSLRHNYIWVDANTTTDKYIDIYASKDQPISYVNIKQESDSSVSRSRIKVRRPDNRSYCFIANWDNQKTIQSDDTVISSTVLWSEPYPGNVVKYTSGYLRITWDVETNDSGARLNVWVW